MFDTVKRIFELRDNRNMTTNEFAKFAKVSQPYLSELESGAKKRVSVSFVEKICDACGINLSEFFKGSDNPANIKASILSREKDDLIDRVEKLKIELDHIQDKLK